ncbi:MAG: TetR/AcrR family transcriptional regulator [Solirubrobacteraceae bacterium]
MSPRPKITEVRREQIVCAALDVIAERGFQDTRLADIAERAGCSAPAVLYHFTAKDEILDAVVSLAEDRFYEGVEATLEQEVGPVARLVRLLESAARDDDGEETVTMWKMWLEIWTRALREPHSAHTRQLLDRRWRGVLAETIAEGQRAGELPDSVAPGRVALMLASLMDGLAVQFALGDSEVTAARMTETLMFAAERALGCALTPSRAAVAGVPR